MKKKALLRRIEALETCLGRYIQREEVLTNRVKDLEEIVFEVDLCDTVMVNVPDRGLN